MNIIKIANFRTALRAPFSFAYSMTNRPCAIDVTYWICTHCSKMEWIYVTTRTLCQGSIELASLMNKEERRKFNFYNHLVQDEDDHFWRYFCTCQLRITRRFWWWWLEMLKVYLEWDMNVLVMYYAYGVSWPSLLIESTDSMIVQCTLASCNELACHPLPDRQKGEGLNTCLTLKFQHALKMVILVGIRLGWFIKEASLAIWNAFVLNIVLWLMIVACLFLPH